MSDDLVVIGCPVANRAWCLPQWFDGVRRQVDGRWRTAFVYTESEDDTLSFLRRYATVIIDGGESQRTREQQDQHWWPEAHYEDMARWRNMLLDYCVDVGAEWFFSVDSDIMLPPGAFTSLRDTIWELLQDGFGAVAPVVNMAVHLDGFAYNYMHWNDQTSSSASRPDHILPDRPFSAGVIMAAMLIHRSAFHVRWHSHPQGEDLGWSYDAKTKGVRLLVDPRIACNHLMRRTTA